MTIESQRLDRVRENVLDRMETGRRMVRYATLAAALLEAAMLVTCIVLVDWTDRTQILLFLIFILSYFIIVLGMVAVAGHVTTATGRILAVLDPRADEPS